MPSGELKLSVIKRGDMKNAWIAIVLVFVFFSCGGKDNRFSSPRATVATFIDAAVSQDANKLSECISKRSTSPDLTMIRDSKISPNDLIGVADAFDGAVISGEQMVGADSQAVVSVNLESRNIEIALIKEGGLWKIDALSEAK